MTTMTSWALCWAVLGLCIFQAKVTQGQGKYIPLASEKEPKSIKEGSGTKISQQQLFELWSNAPDAKDNKLTKDKTFVLGSKEPVNYNTGDIGFFDTLLTAYNNHWVLKTTPEDWWLTISQKIAMTIDREANHPNVRSFFVNHEGKKRLVVDAGASIYQTDYPSFFREMSRQIRANINKPGYTDAMETDFSSSTPEQKIVSNIMLMYSFKEYFDYVSNLFCGIPGVEMMGSEADWQNMITKLERVETILEPLEEQLKLGKWFRSSRRVLQKLLDTFRGNPDQDWWLRIMTMKHQGGSGGGTYIDGWYVREFLGKTGKVNYQSLKSGLNAVPLIVTNGQSEETAALVAGVTGYKVEERVDSVRFNTTIPVVSAVQGWGLLMSPDAIFRN